MKKLVLFGLLVACGAKATQVHGPDGEPGWYSIECKSSKGNCYEKAGEVCPDGYVTADSTEHRGVAVNSTQAMTTVQPTYDGSMLIKCK